MEKKNDLFSRINERYERMSKGHKAIANYIFEHYDQAVFMTAAKLGGELGISESTVVRFASGIGYGGYPEFQKALEEFCAPTIETTCTIPGKENRQNALNELLANARAALREQFAERCRFSEIILVPTGGISTVYAYDGGTIIAY